VDITIIHEAYSSVVGNRSVQLKTNALPLTPMSELVITAHSASRLDIAKCVE